MRRYHKENISKTIEHECTKITLSAEKKYETNIIKTLKRTRKVYTPGKLSQVPPRRYRLNGCDRYPELPVMVKN